MKSISHFPSLGVIHMGILVLTMTVLLAACGGGDALPAVSSITPPAQQAVSPTDTVECEACFPETETPPVGGQADSPTQVAMLPVIPLSVEPTAADAPAPSGIDACALLTKEEVEAALGAPVGSPQREDFPPVYGCKYETENFDYLSISILEYSDAAQAEAGYQMAIDINAYEEVSGIGDRAYRSFPIGDITVLTGKYELSIDLSGDDEESQFLQATDLAGKALARMP